MGCARLPIQLLLYVLGCLSLAGGAWAQGPDLDGLDLPESTILPGHNEIAANVDLAWDYVHAEAIPEALTRLRNWELLDPSAAEYPFTLGAILYEEGDYPVALDAFNRALAANAAGMYGVWARLYAADILLTRHVPAHAERLLDEALQREGTPASISFAANLRNRLRIRTELSEVNQVGDFTYLLTPYMIPPAERPAVYERIEQDWRQLGQFLGLAPTVPVPTIYLYPSDRLYEQFNPGERDLRQAHYAHREVHWVYRADEDALNVLAPYGLYHLARQLRRGGEPFYLIAPSLAAAVRGTRADGLSLAAIALRAKEEGKLPLIESLLDARNVGRLPPAITEPLMALLVRFLRETYPFADWQQALVHPGFIHSRPRDITTYERDFQTWLLEQTDLLADQTQLEAAIAAIPQFNALPIIDRGLQQALTDATALYDSGERERALEQIEDLLRREPRYGRARYLKAKDLFDRYQWDAAEREFAQVLLDLAPGTSASAFSHFYLGRIATMRKDFALALSHYQQALDTGLPSAVGNEAQAFITAITHFAQLEPIADQPPLVDAPMLLLSFDQLLNAGTIGAGAALIHPNASPEWMAQFVAYYGDPKHLKYGAGWRHRVTAASQPDPSTLLVETIIDRIERDGSIARGWLPEVRRFLFVQTPTGPLIADFADEAALLRHIDLPATQAF